MENGKIKKIIFLAITLAVIANLLLGNSILAKKLELTDEKVGNIKNGLDLMKLLLNLSIDDTKLKTILNLFVEGGQTGTDVTYGLLVLSVFNEMEFIDLVVSQRYKTEATKYFESVLDDRLNLISYYRGIGYDIPRIAMGKITGPMAALTLNTFDITDKTITILSMIKVLEREMKYDGLWVYFDQRRGNNSHEEAWEFAEKKLGGLAIKNQRRFGEETRGEKITQLENQFAVLYDKWGPYTDEKGITKEFREQAKKELRDTINLAINDYDKLAKREEIRISFWGKVKNTLAKLADKVEMAGNSLKEEFVKINNKVKQLAGFGGAQISQVSNESSEAVLEPQVIEAGPRSILPEESIIEEIQELEKKVEEAQAIAEVILPEANVIEAGPQSLEVATTVELIEEDLSVLEVKPVKPTFCQKVAGDQPARDKIIFQGIAWMGTKNSASDEWLKVKNISGSGTDLAGWQISDKDQQVKIAFDRGPASIILGGGIFLLERTNDDSLLEAEADLIYTGALNDIDEELYLFDNACRLQDEVSASPDWPAGDKNNHWPMERNVDLTWRNEGGKAVIFNYGTPTVPPPPTPSALSKVLISEIRISPLGDRFIELYNPNNETVNLTGWYIQRKTQTGSSWNSFVSSTNFEGKTIGAWSYFLIASSSESDINLSLTLTEGNSLVLKNSDQETVDKVGWGNAQEYETATTGDPGTGQSVGRKNNIDTDDNQSDFELQTPSPKNSSGNIVAFFVSGEENATTTPAAEIPTLSVAINEIAWAGTRADSSDEWLELYNNSTSTIDLAGWTLSAEDGTPAIAFSAAGGTTTIPAGGFYLLERTASNTTSIAEDYVFTGALNNSGEKLMLKDAEGVLIDLVDFSSGWPADSGSPNYISMERVGATTSGTSAANWASNNLIARNGRDVSRNKINGTPRSQNSVSVSATLISYSVWTDLFNEFSEITLIRWGSPYLIQDTLTVPAAKTLKIGAGTFLKFNNSKSLEIQGNLEALGENNDKIVFTSSSENPHAGSWERLYFAANSSSTLKNTIIRYGGKHYSGPSVIRGNVETDGGKIILEDSIIENSLTYGLWLKNASSSINNLQFSNIQNSPDFGGTVAFLVEGGSSVIASSAFQNNTIGMRITGNADIQVKDNLFQNNETPILLSSNNSSTTFSGNQVQNNDINGILTDSSTITVDTVWQSDSGLPFVIDYTKAVDSSVTLTIKGGTVVKMKPQTGTNWTADFTAYGRLAIEGTASNPVVITSFKDDEYGGDTNNDGTSTLPVANNWKYWRFASTTATSTLEWAVIRYGGGSCEAGICWGGIWQKQGVGIEIRNSTIEKNIWGIFSEENSCSAIFNKIILENTVFNQNTRNIHRGFGNECTPP